MDSLVYLIKNFKNKKMARINFELGGIQDGEGVSKTSLTDCSYASENIRNLVEALRSRYGLDFETVLTDIGDPRDYKPVEGGLERLGVQSPRICLLNLGDPKGYRPLESALERPDIQGLRSCLLRNNRLNVLISNNDREAREGRLTHSWDRGYMDERISYQVLTGYVEGDFGNGELKSVASLIEECAQKTRREFSVCSDEESARIDTR